MTVVFLGIWWPPLCNCWFGCERVKVSMECSYPQSGTVEPQDIWDVAGERTCRKSPIRGSGERVYV